jgi:hypothetical protein
MDHRFNGEVFASLGYSDGTHKPGIDRNPWTVSQFELFGAGVSSQFRSIRPRGTPKTGQSGTPQNRPVEIVI